jgi:sugar phosphate isomerase/epimerase
MRVGVQLRPWLIQEPPPTLGEVLREAARAGYDNVEIGAHYLDWDHPEALRRDLEQNGLSLSGVHVGGDIFSPDNVTRVRASLEKVAGCAAAVGTAYLLYSGLLIEHKTPQELQSELVAINEAAETCARYGLRLLYHHHWWEIARDYADLRVYLAGTDPGQVSFCLDVGWVYRAGGDPLQAMALCAGRAPYFHLRDDTPGQRWMGLGQGAIDFPSILQAMVAQQAAWAVVEQDDITGSVAGALRASLEYLRARRIG